MVELCKHSLHAIIPGLDRRLKDLKQTEWLPRLGLGCPRCYGRGWISSVQRRPCRKIDLVEEDRLEDSANVLRGESEDVMERDGVGAQ